jgi:hypothetical protein
MKIGPYNPEKDSPAMAGSQNRLEKLNDEQISTRAEIGRLADLARQTDRVELSSARETDRNDDIYSKRQIEETFENNESGSLSERRRQEILDRIERGFYNSDEVKSRIIDVMLGKEDEKSIEE